MKKAGVLSYPLSAQRRLWSDWADAQADLSLRWAHSHFAGFVMSRLMYVCLKPWSCVHAVTYHGIFSICWRVYVLFLPYTVFILYLHLFIFYMYKCVVAWQKRKLWSGLVVALQWDDWDNILSDRWMSKLTSGGRRSAYSIATLLALDV